MSARITSWAWDQECPSAKAKLVLLKMADWCQCDDDALPYFPEQKVNRLAAPCGMTGDELEDVILSMKDIGLIGLNDGRLSLNCPVNDEAHENAKFNQPPTLGYVYLMKNSRNGLTKIGHSSNPVFREKTLQAEEPEINLLHSAESPKKNGAGASLKVPIEARARRVV